MRSGGVVLHESADVDALRFLRDVQEAGSARGGEDELRLLDEALARWRGMPFQGVDSHRLREWEAPRLVECHLAALERRVDLDIAAGRHGDLLTVLTEHAARHPLRESLWHRLLLMLVHSGRQAEALEHYEQIRTRIRDDLGADPHPSLQRVHRMLLTTRNGGDVRGRAPELTAEGKPVPCQPPSVIGTFRRPAAELREPMASQAARSPAGDGPVGELIRGWRERALLTQDQLAERTGLSARTIRRFEIGRASRARAASIRLLAEALGLDAEEQAVLMAGLASGRADRPREVPAGFGRPVAVPWQAPADVPSFVGRERELSIVDDACAGSAAALVIVNGMPGVGKTALAVHAAHRLASRFPDGVLFADLNTHAWGGAPLDPGEVLGRFLRSLGIAEERVPRLAQDRAVAYRTELTGRRVLVVLDGAVSESQVRPLLPGALGCAALVTSQYHLEGLERTRTVTLGDISPSEAVGLFAEIVGRDRLTGAGPRAVEQVTRRCAMLPLALYVTAARLRSHPTWNVEDLLERLDGKGRLAELEAGERGVAAAFDQSYERLTDDQQRAYRLLGRRTDGGFDLRTAARLLACDVAGARRVIDRLVEAHLLQEPDAGRYRFHDLVHDHASTVRPDQAGEDRLPRRAGERNGPLMVGTSAV
ncbi:AfsR/SARP family transcriptional regulator [Actinomadura madurae]|uniref:AfsR/SARP family transcriptional regulator n=1 Tax=Actinomadura madurae TaxID=1993 RepID=UPI000D871EA4|nr:BTAD domain-containing putative transcriptional regulator [Actinomadura madurae]SPT51276.1 Regulatory protein AfsR [Actinomadura madurae]